MATRDEDFVTSLFVASTHAWLLFFSSTGMAYKLKVWRLPEARIAGKGKAMVNLLPLAQGERITTILALPEDDGAWDTLNVVFATKSGDVRRNQLSDFAQVNKNGKIAMKLAEGDGIIGVATCTDADDFLLTTGGGKAIRFPVAEVRVFKGRDSTGVRGIKLGKDDAVVSLALLYHSDATSAEARSYLKQASAIRRAESGEAEAPVEADDDTEEGVEEANLTAERYAALGAREQFVLTLSQNGFGKRSSSYEYRVTGRGGSGIVAIGMGKKNSAVIGSFPVEESDDLMLISDAGQTIRVAVSGISIQGRAAQGVTVFRVDDGEKVVSVERIADVGGSE
jgi:DNA gyrase subunit A